jgi:uncharacterized 2Fe-2S/4Fe-4S cluster protein (DUF4445 family)
METCTVYIQPRHVSLTVPKGTQLQRLLFDHGAEFPCGGRGTCKRCKVKVLAGELPIKDGDKELPVDELDAGMRLACLHTVESDLTLELEQWGHFVLADDRVFDFHPREGLGIAFDLGSTTIAGQLLDCETGDVLAVESGRNPQSAFGADIMSRISYAIEGGQIELQAIVREQMGRMATELMKSAPEGKLLKRIVIVGNSPMHNLFCGIDITPLSHFPFIPESTELFQTSPDDLGWTALGSDAEVFFLPSIGCFVGSDILAGVMATHLDQVDGIRVFVDLGTNGEIVVGNGRRTLCASTAAGPAFEAATISCGMQASAGAINAAKLRDGTLVCSTIGGVDAQGVCGSGLVDVVARMLENGTILPSGRFSDGKMESPMTDSVSLTQKDIRELQLAKGAVSVGIRVLLDTLGADLSDVSQVFLAGAFGNYVNLQSAADIGMLRFPQDKMETVGNTALLGAKMALFEKDLGPGHFLPIIGGIEHIELSQHPRFQEFYMDEMTF